VIDERNCLGELPKGWIWVKVRDVVSNISLTGRKLKQKQYVVSGKLPVVDQGQKIIGGYTDREELKVNVEPPVIVFGDHTKIVKYLDFDFVAGADGIKVLKPLEAFYPRLFYYFLQVIQLPEKGYARHFQFLEKSFIPLPPFNEQERIVARLEELFTRLDAGVEGLRKVKAQLKRYRQAVLKYAFEGKLTEEWRKTHKNQIEPAQKLLEHIKQERRKDPKHKELPPINIADLSELPENWTWTRLGEIGIVASGGTPSTKIHEYFDGDVPWITPADLSDFTGKFIHRGRRNISEKGLNSSSAVLLPEGTILFSSRAPIGYVVIAANPVSTNQGFKNLILYEGIFNEYVFYYLKASKILAESYGSGTTFGEVSAARFSLIPIPLAPLNEQHRIVEEIEQCLSLVYETQKTIAQAIRQSDRLRQSILKRAFEGRLVSQDPNDEPAEKLLERIKEERAKSKGEKDINKKETKPKQLELSNYVK